MTIEVAGHLRYEGDRVRSWSAIRRRSAASTERTGQVAALSDILRRFRFHGVPGAPAVVAVPADRAAEVESELAPVFATLDAAQRSSRELVAAAQSDARRSR